MSRILTVAVTRLVPVTEVFSIEVPDEFDIDEKVGTDLQIGNPGGMYDVLEKDGVKVIHPVEGEAQEYQYTKTDDQPGAAVSPEEAAGRARLG